MPTKLDRLTELAKEEPKRQFFSIAHLITPEAMYAAFRSLRKDASAGVDGVTHQEYQKDAERNIQELYQRLKDGKYQAQPLRRVYIPKENGKQRPISIPALEDKIVQKAMVEVLNTIYEQDFLECSYGFRPGRAAPSGTGRREASHMYPLHGMDPRVRHHRLLRFDRERATHRADRETRQR